MRPPLAMKNPHAARSVADLVKTIDAGAKPQFSFFWSHRPAQAGSITRACLSQWYLSPFCVNGLIYPTAEHYMMAAKARLFGDFGTLEQILVASSPGAAKALGRTVEGFDNNVWAKNRYETVVEGNVEKFGQNPALLAFLLGTREQILVEASPSDSIWGIGLSENDIEAENPVNWPGLNLLGFALMEARARLSTAEAIRLSRQPTAKRPSADTLEAMLELENGGGTVFESADDLFADWRC